MTLQQNDLVGKLVKSYGFNKDFLGLVLSYDIRYGVNVFDISNKTINFYFSSRLGYKKPDNHFAWFKIAI